MLKQRQKRNYYGTLILIDCVKKKITIDEIDVDEIRMIN